MQKYILILLLIISVSSLLSSLLSRNNLRENFYTTVNDQNIELAGDGGSSMMNLSQIKDLLCTRCRFESFPYARLFTCCRFGS